MLHTASLFVFHTADCYKEPPETSGIFHVSIHSGTRTCKASPSCTDILPRTRIQLRCNSAALHGNSTQSGVWCAGNILLDSSGNVKVADFGLSRLQAATCGEPLTAELGTWQWMAPEVVAPWDKRGAVYTEKADVYSFGIVMWECAAREASLSISQLLAKKLCCVCEDNSRFKAFNMSFLYKSVSQLWTAVLCIQG